MENNFKDNFTSFDFMKIFNIKQGSWNYIKNKLNLDDYSTSVIDKRSYQVYI